MDEPRMSVRMVRKDEMEYHHGYRWQAVKRNPDGTFEPFNAYALTKGGALDLARDIAMQLGISD